MTINDLYIFGGMHNIFRAYEIAYAGRFKIKLINSPDEDNKLSAVQFVKLKEHLSEVITESANEAHIFVEVTKPAFSEIFSARRTERKTDNEERATKAIKNKVKLPEHINEAGMSLLKTAYDRLDFQPYEVDIILRVAQVISLLENPKGEKIDTAHLAEAIQYRAIERESRE